MSQELYEERLGHVETGLAGVKADVRVLSHDLAGLKSDVGKIGDGVSRLLEREAKRPEPTTLKSVLTTLATAATAIASVGFFVWWFVGTSPALEEMRKVERDLAERLMRLDDPDVGRVTRLERDLGRWAPTIVRGQ